MKNKIILSLMISGFAVNSYAFSGAKGQYYMLFNAGGMSQQINQKYTPTAPAGLSLTSNKSGIGPYAQLGTGYYILDDLRFDVLVHYDRGAKIKQKMVTAGVKRTLKVRENSIGALLNFYYDISTSTKFMPYIMGGVGGMRNSISATYLDATGKSDTANKTLTKMAYQFGAGVNTHLGVNWEMDIGVRLLNKGQKKKKKNVNNSKGVITQFESLDTQVATEPKMVRSVLVGLRHTF